MKETKRDEAMHTHVGQFSVYYYALMSVDIEMNQSVSISYNPRRDTGSVTPSATWLDIIDLTLRYCVKHSEYAWGYLCRIYRSERYAHVGST